MSLKSVVGGRAESLRVREGNDSKSDPDKGKWIIDAESSVIVTTTKVHPSEPEEPEEGECLFHL
jgi:hypothetical protein